MTKIVKKGYRGRSKQSQARIAAGIWHKYPAEAKIGIIKRLAGGVGGVPSEMNPFTSTGLYYPTKGTKEARDKMTRLRKMKRHEHNPLPLIPIVASMALSKLQQKNPLTPQEQDEIVSTAEGYRQMGRSHPLNDLMAPFYIGKGAGYSELADVYGRSLEEGRMTPMEANPLASAEVLAELAKRRQAELLAPSVAIPDRRTVYWIAGGDDANTELRVKIIKKSLEDKYRCPIEVVRSPGQKIWGRQGRRPGGWEFISVR
jgi:hypothetical protein